MSCPSCKEGYTLPGEPIGVIEKEFNNAYFSPAPGGRASNRAIILLTDAFGMGLNNCKIMADEFARRLDCDVWIPDYFDGKPLFPASGLRAPDHAAQKMSIVDWLMFFLFVLPNIPALIRSRPSVSDARVLLKLLKAKKMYKKIGAVGYCYGGATAVRFAGTNYIDSAVICHPGSFDMKDVEAIRVPTSWACAEVDVLWSHKHRLQSEKILTTRKDKGLNIEYEFIDYKGTSHGFASRPNINLPKIKEAHGKAIDQAVSWFDKTLTSV